MPDADRLGLYVDVENLMDIAKEAIVYVFANWPEELPRPRTLRLYVRGDQVDLWRVWANDRYPSLEIQVAGVQHYALQGLKNSADITLALDAITDLLRNRTTHTAVLSDDSDFVALFIKISQEIPKRDSGKIPFIWFQTNRSDTRSTILEEFLPPNYVRMVVCSEKKVTATRRQSKSSTEQEGNQEELMAKAIIEKTEVGLFKSTDCIKLLRQQFPEHSLAKLDHANFGTQFVKTILPRLERYGVRVSNPGKKPRRYEMTKEAKLKVATTS